MRFLTQQTLLYAAGGALTLALSALGVSRLHRFAHKSYHTPATGLDFARDVEPIFSENCLECHGSKKQKGGLRLDLKEVALHETDSGETAIIPGDTARSAILLRTGSSDPDEQMPPKGDRLSQAKIDILRRWIAAGANWPADAVASAPTSATGLAVTDKDRQYWAFRPLQRAAPPQPGPSAWALTPIDRFILSAQEAKGLHPNPAASKETLIRRVTFDLIGLPPSPEEIDAFERDTSPSAYEHLVDRLLADPHYGERWGRHWLDVARYADSDGYEEDRPRPDAWHYRDFVISAFNADLPYDRFLQWQIAGDLLAPNDPNALAATGFMTAAPEVRPDSINFRKKDRCDELDDIVATTGSAFLGLTLGCARCHDHKFDPIPTRDYYRLTAFFTSTERVERPVDARQGEDYERRKADHEKRLKEADKERKKWAVKLREQVRLARIDAFPVSNAEKALLRAPKTDANAEQKRLLQRFHGDLNFNDDVLRASISEDLRAKWDALEKAVKDMEDAKLDDVPRMLTIEEGQPQKSYLLPRGDSEHPGPEVTPGMLSVLSPANAGTTHSASSRADLARWLTDEVHGAGALVARVAVNRLWQHHFGRGLVDTPGDFGVRGDPPSNPALLDWLASELIRGGWRIAPLQKQILMSAVYRQDVAFDAARAAIDPANRLWWRREPERLEAEILRDSILSISGRLNAALFGPSVKPRINPEAITITNPSKQYDEWPRDVIDGPATWRRSVYVFAKRANLFPFLQAFDAPNAIGSCTRRSPTTVAPQALALMNDSFVRDRARDFASRLAPLGPIENRIPSAFLLAFGRKPTGQELAKSLHFLEIQTKEYLCGGILPEPEKAAFADFCQALIGSNEFSSID